MKICFVLPTLGDSGGVSIVMNLAKKLAEEGHEIKIIRPIVIPNVKGWRYKEITNFMKLLVWIPLNLLNHNKKKYTNTNIEISRVLTLNHLPKHYDIYIATWWETAYFINKIKNKRKIYFIQGFETWYGNKEMVTKTYNYEGFKMVTICKYLKQRINDYTSKEISLVYNEVDLGKFGLIEGVRDNNSVGIIYREHSLKGFDKFIDYLASYRRDDVSYFLVGRNIPKKYIHRFNYVFNGHSKNDLELFYNKIGLLVIPSDEEGFGLPIIESMMCKTPVAVKNIGIAYELIQNRINSFILETNSAENINDVINEYMSLSLDQKINIQNAAYNTIHSSYKALVKKSEQQFIEIIADNGEKL